MVELNTSIVHYRVWGNLGSEGSEHYLSHGQIACGRDDQNMLSTTNQRDVTCCDCQRAGALAWSEDNMRKYRLEKEINPDDYFPMVIRIVGTGEIRAIDSVKELPQGVPIEVLEK